MNKQKDHDSFERLLEQYFSAPIPRKDFLVKLEQSLKTTPTIKPHPLRMMSQRVTFRPIFTFLMAGFLLLIILLAIGPTRVLAALQVLMGYIPGFGMVTEASQLRTIAEPVSVTRDGVTVTVVQVIISPERTGITAAIQGLPPQALPSWTVSDKGHICTPVTELRLPDGTRLEQNDSGSGYAGNTYQWNYFFQPVPVKVNQATWVLSCLPDTLIAKAPENWDIPLYFVPAPSNLTVLPVDVIAPSVNSTPSVTRAPATIDAGSKTTDGNPLSLDKVIETEDGYIFIGRFRQILPAQVTSISPEILDANGLLQGYTIPGDIPTSPFIDQGIEWAYQIHNKNIAWPISIRFNSVDVYCSDPQAKLILDTGASPQNGQIWEIKQDFSIGPCNIHIISIKRIDHGYIFRAGHTNVNQFMPEIEGITPKETNSYDYPTYIDVRIQYDKEPPTGLITVSLSSFSSLPGPWQVKWQPGQEQNQK